MSGTRSPTGGVSVGLAKPGPSKGSHPAQKKTQKAPNTFSAAGAKAHLAQSSKSMNKKWTQPSNQTRNDI